MHRSNLSTCSRPLVSAVHRIRQSSERRCFKALPLAAYLVLSLFVSGLLAGAVPAEAQTAALAGFQSTVPTSGLGTPTDVAIDSKGDIFIVDKTNNEVLEESPNAGSYTQSTVVTGLDQPAGIAIDASGNLYISDYGSNRILKETPGTSGYTQSVVDSNNVSGPMGIAVDVNGNVYVACSLGDEIIEDSWNGSVYTQRVIPTSTLNAPSGVAVDSSGNIYVADTHNSRVLKETPSGSSYIETTIGSSLSYPWGVALDAAGNLYIAENGTNQIVSEVYSGGSYTQGSIASSGLNFPTGIAVDSAGDVYVADQDNGRVVEETQTAKFETTQVGNPSQPVTAIFNFATTVTSVQPQVVADGITGLDFSAAGTGTCTTNGTSYNYSAGDTCTIDIIFDPKFPGVRYGAAELLNSSGSPIATAYVQGTGTGPMVNFPPGNVAPLSLPGVTSPYAIAVDEAGDLYITEASSAYATGNNLVKETWNGSSWTEDIIATGFIYPVGVAVDPAGDVYVADEMGTVYKEAPSGGTYTQSTVDTNLGTLTALTADSVGNVYVSSNAYGLVKEALTSGGTYVRSVFPNRIYSDGLAVDANGDIFATSSITNTVLYEEVYSGGTYTQETLLTLSSGVLTVALDGFGDIYLNTGQAIYKETPSSGSYIQTQVASGMNGTLGITVDSLGNLYVTNDSGNTVWRVDVSDPPSLTFESTPFGSTSLDSPKSVVLQNAGNGTLDFPVQSVNNNPYTSQSFSLASNSASDCPVAIVSSANPTSLAAGSTCELSVSFTPQQLGTVSGSLVLTDNAPNQTSPSYAQQIVNLSGTSTQAIPPVTWNTPAPIPYGTVLSATQLDASSTVSGTFVYSPAAGTILSIGTHTLTATFTPTDTADYTTATVSVTLTVNQATPSIVWSTPAPITYGAALGATQLDASSAVAGTFAYSPAAGTVLSAGTHILTATFTPTDTADYTTSTASVTLTVDQATPTITWPTPAAIAVGTALSSTQLDATASVAGSFAYQPAAGTVLPVGSQTLTTKFTPTNSADYTTATASVALAVVNPAPAISSISPAVADMGGSAFTITVNGSGFEPGSTIFLGKSSLTTTLVSGSQLTAPVPASAISSAGTLAVTVQTPSPGGGASNSFELEVDSAGSFVTPPTASPISVTVNPGSSAVYTVQLPSNATKVSATCLNLPAGATCTYSASANTVTIKTSATTPPGTYSVTIVFTETIPVSTTVALSLPFFLLPFAGGIRNRFSRTRVLSTICFVFILTAASIFISGCGGNGPSSSGSQSTVPTQTVTSSVVVTLKIQ